MNKYNSKNERIKRAYFEFEKEARQKSIATIDNIRKSLDRFEEYTKHADFKTFNKNQAMGFKKWLSNTKAIQTKEPLSKSTMLSTIRNLKAFFGWLKFQTGYKKISANDIEYFNLSEKDTRIAKSTKPRKCATVEQIKHVIGRMPYESDIQKRDRALIAFTLITGIRDSAMASLKIKHVDLQEELVLQSPDEVNTKASKQIYTYFLPIDNETKQIVIDWIKHLKTVLLYDEEAPLFPRTKIIVSEEQIFKAEGLEPFHWETANPIRQIFKEAFETNSLPYYSPHTFRNTLARYGERICKTPEEFKAWSQNLGHESPLTTFTSYGYIEPHSQGEVIRKIAKKDDVDYLREMYDMMKERGLDNGRNAI